MRKHTKVYFDYFGIDYDQPTGWHDQIQCEVCNEQAVDIHHIERRGMGGSKLLDVIENLMALCRRCHDKYGDVPEAKSFLKQKHESNLSKIR